MMEALQVEGKASLFDEFGRRIPLPGMRVYSQVSRRYFVMDQPEIDFELVYERSLANFQDTPGQSLPFKAGVLRRCCKCLERGILKDPAMANLFKAVHVPFICPPLRPQATRHADAQSVLQALEQVFSARFPEGDFRNLCQGEPDQRVGIWDVSRYEQFESARRTGVVVGWYFPNTLSEFDLASQRRQMASLPAAIPIPGGEALVVLSGLVEAAAGIMGTPELLFGEVNKRQYPHHLCLSALQTPEDALVYTFEAYAQTPPALRFRNRSNILLPGISQLSEQWAGGLTVFTKI